MTIKEENKRDRMNVFCKLCKTNIVATDDMQLTVLMVAHALQKHPQKYLKQMKEIAKIAKKDYILSEDYYEQKR